MQQPSVNEELDENKIDFELLQQRQRIGSSSSSASTVLSGRSTSPDEVWPLHLMPRFIDHYITGDLIGSGSYAEVRECVDTRTLERCALKIINKEYLVRQAPRALANQIQEIRILRHFRHVNIITMRECLFRGSYIYIALEFCTLNLNELLNDQVGGKFNVPIARRFFHQLCFGVAYLHSSGIVHRDIKPDNLLLTNTGTLKIIDFGVSHMLSMWNESDKCSNYEGTPLFQSPEVISGQADYHGFKVDIWSCGVTLFRMLFGTYPFIDEALLGLYDKILGQDLDIPARGPTTAAIRDLIAIMLDKDHRRRASIEQVLEHPWLKLCHANLHGMDEVDEGDLFELVTAPKQQRSATKDVYRSMTVLPYLYRHHFSHLPIKKNRSSRNSDASSLLSYQRERLNPMSSTSTSQSSTYSTNTLASTEDSRSSNTPGSSAPSSPAGQIDENRDHDEANQIEWGTEEQYQLMKIPRVRANRVRPDSSQRRRRRRRRHRNASKHKNARRTQSSG